MSAGYPPSKPPRSPRLMFVVPDAAAFVSHRLRLAVAAKANGFRVAVACPPASAVEEILAAGAEHYPFRAARRSMNPLREIVTAITIGRAMWRFRPDIVHLVTSKAVIYGGTLARLARIPSLAAIPGLGRIFLDDHIRARTLRWLVSRGYRAAVSGERCTILFQNQDDLDLFRRAGIFAHSRIAMIPGSGVDLELIKPQPLPDGVPVVGLPARLIRDKGVGEFAEAAKLLKGRGVAVRFRLLGDPDPGNPTTVTVQEIRDWVDAGILEWQPHTRDINNALAACHIVALPSYREGFPKALIDAAAAGRAVAASDVAGCRHAIVEGRTGVLFTARDAASLANAIERLLEDPKRLQTMGAAARHHAEQNFDIEEVTKRHLELYASLLAIARPPLSKRPNS